MKAAWYERNGAPLDVLIVGELPDPHPGPGEVRVRLRTSGVNPSDVKSRAGSARKIAFPRQVPGSDGAGSVDEVGDGVPEERHGQRVWIYNAARQRPLGTSAEYVVLPAAQAVPLPEAADFDAGACFGIPVITAHRAVFADGPIAGRTLLVSGGAGVVGHYAVQLAKWGGARVIASVSSDQKAAHARAGGADHTIDYKREDVAQLVQQLTDGEGVDHVVEVEFAGNLELNLRALKMGGVLAAYGSTSDRRSVPVLSSSVQEHQSAHGAHVRTAAVGKEPSDSRHQRLGRGWASAGSPSPLVFPWTRSSLRTRRWKAPIRSVMCCWTSDALSGSPSRQSDPPTLKQHFMANAQAGIDLVGGELAVIAAAPSKSTHSQTWCALFSVERKRLVSADWLLLTAANKVMASQ